MVHERIWKKAGAADGFLCVVCLEKRLGRRLRPNDFTDAPINEPDSWDTLRLASRRSGLRPGSVKHTAYHEAGHAVIARVLTLAAGRATIEPNFAEGSAGYGITRDPYQCEWQWERRGKVRPRNAAWHARIMTYMAGAEAEIAYLGRCKGGDGNDRYQIALMLEEITCEPDALEARLRAMTRTLVKRHRARIARVAQALLAETTLSGKKLDRLIGRSVNDVKPNSPWLLAMHTRNYPSTMVGLGNLLESCCPKK